MTAVNDGTNDRVVDTYKGHLLEKRTYANGVYLTHLDDNGANLSGYSYRCLCQVAECAGGMRLLRWAKASYSRWAAISRSLSLRALTVLSRRPEP